MVFKIYVDSRFKEDVPGATDCDFKIQLPHPIVVSGKAFVDVCLVPNTFNTIKSSVDPIMQISLTTPSLALH